MVEGQLGPDEVVGTHDTLAGDTITIKGEVPELTVNEATIICGNIPTANATVYVDRHRHDAEDVTPSSMRND